MTSNNDTPPPATMTVWKDFYRITINDGRTTGYTKYFDKREPLGNFWSGHAANDMTKYPQFTDITSTPEGQSAIASLLRERPELARHQPLNVPEDRKEMIKWDYKKEEPESKYTIDIIHYRNKFGRLLWTSPPFGSSRFSRLHGPGEHLVENFKHYKVLRVAVADNIQHVNLDTEKEPIEGVPACGSESSGSGYGHSATMKNAPQLIAIQDLPPIAVNTAESSCGDGMTNPSPVAGGESQTIRELLRDVPDAVDEAVAELGDRNSPEEWPEAMLVTGKELREIVRDKIESALSSTPPAPLNQSARIAELQSTISKMRNDQLVPGLWQCKTCKFQLSKQTMFMSSGTIGLTEGNVIEPELCHNDGLPMERVTWHEYSDLTDLAFKSQVDRACNAEALVKSRDVENARLREQIEHSYKKGYVTGWNHQAQQGPIIPLETAWQNLNNYAALSSTPSPKPLTSSNESVTK